MEKVQCDVSKVCYCRDLRFNNIKDIPSNIFEPHKNIRSLLLNNNYLTELQNGAFTGLQQLRHLYLYKNQIKEIGPKVFQGLLKLEHLYVLPYRKPKPVILNKHLL